MSRPPEGVAREAEAGDLADLARLEALAFGDPWSETQLAAQLALATTRCWILAAGAPPGPRAYALFQVAGGEAELLRVGVDPPSRGRGLAGRLLAASLAALAAQGVRRCFLEVAIGNCAALALYRRLGFRQVGHRRAYYPSGEDALLLARPLPGPGTGRSPVLS